MSNGSFVSVVGGTASGGNSGGSGIWRTEIPVLVSDSPAGSYANGKSFTALRQGQGDVAFGGFTSDYTGQIELVITYAMSSSHAGVVKLTMAYGVVGEGEDPSAALTASSQFTVTPGSNTTNHTLDSEDEVSLGLTVAAGDDVTFSITRGTTGDTHTGDFRILRILVKQV